MAKPPFTELSLELKNSPCSVGSKYLPRFSSAESSQYPPFILIYVTKVPIGFFDALRIDRSRHNSRGITSSTPSSDSRSSPESGAVTGNLQRELIYTSL